ncbi:DUF1800 family protein [Paracoccus sp. (in: a-proteobacteria)]|uniref:DUF1800 domain-containing protein n=1 Tax=Paracoccus sp. TaxID=267 RepID=UPI00396D0001
MSLPYDQLAALRLGFGLSPHHVPPADAKGFAEAVALAAPGRRTVRLDRIREMQIELKWLQALAREGTKEADRTWRQYRLGMFQAFGDSVLERFARVADDPCGFGERLVAFWANHFTVRGGTPHTSMMTASLVDEAIRPHLSGRFADMIVAAETHPAMLIYLDQVRSVGPNSAAARKKPDRAMGLNENLAREMIELHSLGVGAEYSQQDVEALARLLTGLTYNPQKPGVFAAAQAEPGTDRVLGQDYGGTKGSLDDIRAVIEDLARHEATARHLARKLAIHFIADDPPQPLVERLAGVFIDSQGNLAAINLALAEAPELESNFRAKLRPPFEFIAGSLRSLGLTGQDLWTWPRKQRQQMLLQPLEVMGQPWARPDGPDGWPEAAEAWGTPQGIATRINWAMQNPSKLLPQLPDPRGFLQSALGDSASEPLRWAVPRAESAAEGVALVLASADFNRR